MIVLVRMMNFQLCYIIVRYVCRTAQSFWLGTNSTFAISLSLSLSERERKWGERTITCLDNCKQSTQSRQKTLSIDMTYTIRDNIVYPEFHCLSFSISIKSSVQSNSDYAPIHLKGCNNDNNIFVFGDGENAFSISCSLKYNRIVRWYTRHTSTI